MSGTLSFLIRCVSFLCVATLSNGVSGNVEGGACLCYFMFYRVLVAPRRNCSRQVQVPFIFRQWILATVWVHLFMRLCCSIIFYSIDCLEVDLLVSRVGCVYCHLPLCVCLLASLLYVCTSVCIPVCLYVCQSVSHAIAITLSLEV